MPIGGSYEGLSSTQSSQNDFPKAASQPQQGSANRNAPKLPLATSPTFRDKVKVEQSTLPEDAQDVPAATPYRRDVFMLGALVHLILFGEKPPKVGGVYEWASRAEDPFEGVLEEFIKRALSKEPGERFENARQMLEAFNAATARKQENIIDLKAFDAFKAATRESDYQADRVTLTDIRYHGFMRRLPIS